MNERLKEIRKALNLKQDDVGNKIKFSRSHVSSLENGTRELTDRIISDICREFNVNEEWFRHGVGEMFVESNSAIIAELASEYHLDTIDQKIIEYYLQLDEKSRQKIKEHVVALAEQISSVEEIAASIERDIDAEVESYRQELLAEQKGETLSVLPGQKGKSS